MVSRPADQQKVVNISFTISNPGAFQALTASATANVEKDIIDSLRLSTEHLFRCVEPFNRTNLYYEVGVFGICFLEDDIVKLTMRV